MLTLKQAVRKAEREYLKELLIECGTDPRVLAAAAGVSQATFYRALRKHNLTIRSPSKTHASTLLGFFGVQSEPGGDWWRRNSGCLDVMFYDAKRAYLALARRHHPDAGASPDGERMARINNAWMQLEAAFRKHGVEC